MTVKSFITRFLGDERGATAIEYGLICAMIVLAMLGALKGFASSNAQMWNKVQTSTEQAVAGSTA